MGGRDVEVVQMLLANLKNVKLEKLGLGSTGMDDKSLRGLVEILPSFKSLKVSITPCSLLWRYKVKCSSSSSSSPLPPPPPPPTFNPSLPISFLHPRPSPLCSYSRLCSPPLLLPPFPLSASLPFSASSLQVLGLSGNRLTSEGVEFLLTRLQVT